MTAAVVKGSEYPDCLIAAQTIHADQKRPTNPTRPQQVAARRVVQPTQSPAADRENATAPGYTPTEFLAKL